MNTDNFVSIKPFDKELRKYISYYYFHSSNKPSLKKNIIYYPNYKNAITVYKKSKLIFKSNFSLSFPSPKEDINVFYTRIQNNPRTAKIQAPFNKIGIVFQSLGINYFLKKNLNQVTSKTEDMSFNHFGMAFLETCNNTYKKKEVEGKVKILDAYFKNNFQGFKEEKLIRAVSLIENSNQKQTVSFLAEKLNINRRTLLRLFQKHLCCSVKDYIDIVQFRKAVDEYLVGRKDLKNLTELAYQYNFYDQSEFIKHVNKLTGDKPKSFFKNVKHLGNENTFWIIK